ncbi:ferredoxin [Breznakia sp. PF5-3]|uniref:4Fe-4S binding protein n=1 Tax=unclassified Breznakia TaxID=2623764 RepID=UPI0024065ABE|nr:MULTISPECIES: 4Fe-4S binding protein [unclassified Breznakia]MDF9824166.1 ferredoxin [Breznakia sp. PM6-1]MDF9834964.1 ferredoxin [Breznakia sp. PF5-3]MDF9837167.1 ferredoxin [Breznakia sp. PFB2-8]MDF9859157.1 ferredoxin [Breznakia sp. PH5-24]
MIKRKKAQIGKACVACGNCVKYCPVGAIIIHKGLYAQVDENKCVGCGKCAKVCPADVIEIVMREVEGHEKALV